MSTGTDVSVGGDGDAGTPGNDGTDGRAGGVSELDRLWLFAREDAHDAVRERQAHVLAVVFGLLGLGMGYLVGQSSRGRGEAVEVTTGLVPALVMLVPLLALAFVATGLVEKRRTGALTVLLGLPFSRRVVVLGTLLGRCLVVVSATLFALVVGALLGVATGATVDPEQFLVAASALALLACAFVAIAVAISTVSTTTTKATVGAFGAYLLFVFDVWAQLPSVVRYVGNGLSSPTGEPTWVAVFAAANPMTAFANLLAGVSPELADAALVSPATDPAVYEGPVAGAVILLAWIVVPVWLAYWRFRATDV